MFVVERGIPFTANFHLCDFRFGFEGATGHGKPFQLRVKFGSSVSPTVRFQLQMPSVLLPPDFRGCAPTAGFTCVDYRHVTGRVYTTPPEALAHRAAHGIKGFTHNTEAARAYKDALQADGEGVCLDPTETPVRRTRIAPRIAVQALEVFAASTREAGKLTVATPVGVALYVLWEFEDQVTSMRLEFRSV